jgi:sulfite oxidase
MSALPQKRFARTTQSVANQTTAGKHASMLVRQEQPYNAEPPAELLVETHCTPPELFFVRNHGAVAQVDANSFRLTIAGQVFKPLRISMKELRNNFPKTTVTATMQCAGNRRTDFLSLAPIPGEVPWAAQAIGNATWGGVAVAELLRAAELKSDARHIEFCGLDQIEGKGAKFGFGGSIPLGKAMSPEVILAYEMNGSPLPPIHGFPLRAVVPGYLGARSVKWLSDIDVRREPSANYFQAHAYKMFAPHVTEQTADWTKGEVIEEMPVNSVICLPRPGASLLVGRADIRGYAIGTGGDRIDEVQVSTDGGATWKAANLQSRDRWAWSLWRLSLELRAGTYHLVVRARDSSGNTQPADASSIWNFKGYRNNAWHHVQMQVF